MHRNRWIPAFPCRREVGVEALAPVDLGLPYFVHATSPFGMDMRDVRRRPDQPGSIEPPPPLREPVMVEWRLQVSDLAASTARLFPLGTDETHAGLSGQYCRSRVIR